LRRGGSLTFHASQKLKAWLEGRRQNSDAVTDRRPTLSGHSDRHRLNGRFQGATAIHFFRVGRQFIGLSRRSCIDVDMPASLSADRSFAGNRRERLLWSSMDASLSPTFTKTKKSPRTRGGRYPF